jgi:hypothetical protein
MSSPADPAAGPAEPPAGPEQLRAAAEAVLRTWSEQSGVPLQPGVRDGEYVVELPGEAKLRTGVSLLIGDRALRATAFVVRRPDEDHERVYHRLLSANSRLPGIAFALDRLGDVYLMGRIPLRGVTPETVDELLGALLTASDGSFNELLALGFHSSIRREWAWRLDRGESTANLQAFQELRPPD